MKTYQAVFNELTTKGVFGISLVDSPAMESKFIALRKHQEIKLKEIDKEKRILMGLVLEPNKDVYRNQGGEEFNIRFDEETIKNLSYHFFKSGSQKNSTIEHTDKIEGVTFVESWLVENTKTDKSALYGFSYPVGTWVATMKVDDDDVWNNYVKTGKVKGFSIDAMLELKEVNLKSNINMASEILKGIEQLKIALGLKEKPLDVKLGKVKALNEDIEFEYEGEELTTGIAIWANDDDGNRVPLPVGEYPVEGDMIVIVTEEGMISEVKPAEVKEEAVDAPMSDTAPAVESDLEKAIKSILVKYEAQEKSIDALKLEFSKKDELIKGLQKEVVELYSQPAAKPVRQIEQVELNKQGRILSKLRK